MAYEPFKSTFEVGSRVKVLSHHSYRREKLIGLVGTVRSDSGSNVAVVFDDIKNQRSAYGCFYFKPEELVAVDEFVNENMEEKNMNAITNYLNIVRVSYVNEGDKCWYQYANFEPDLKEDDLCVVNTEKDQLKVAKVLEVIDQLDLEMSREVVAKIYTGGYNSRLECRAKAAELKAKMEARAKQLQDIALYQMLAKDDPDMAALLQEYQGLPKV